MFLRNCWYVAAWSHEVGQEPLGRTLLNEPVVLYRTEDGDPVALEDRCCHRGLPLSLGTVEGRRLRCAYHGLLFDRDGACVEVPGQTRMPPGSAVRSYPLVERADWVWIWMGEETPDESLLPDWWWMDHPDWKTVPGNNGKPLHSRCSHRLIVDNLLDLSHLAFVHTDTIGNDEITRFPCRTEREARLVRMERLMPAVEPPPFYRAAGGFEGKVDRWQIVEAILPCYVDVDVGCTEVGRGALDGDRVQGTAFHVPNCPTPETGRTTHHFYAHTRLFRTDSAEMDEVFRTDFLRVFHEDLEIMEAQQRVFDSRPDAPLVDINVDAPALTFKRMHEDALEAETGARTAA